MKNSRIIIGGGGTGGHVFPAIAIAGALREVMPESVILFVGAEGRIEMEKVPEAGFDITGLPVAGFHRKKLWKNVMFFPKLFRSVLKSARIISEFRPDLAVGVGGYASGPILRAAAKRNIPVMIQEQNSYAGVTNRLLARKAKQIFVAYDGMERYFPAEKIVFTGNPVRPGILGCRGKREEGLKFFGLDGRRKTVLVIGGSLGARTINRSLEKNMGDFGKDVQVIWQTGKIYFDEVKEMIGTGGAENILIRPFIREMDLAYAVADVIISRAGAGTISELAVAGKPVILVPSPNVAEDHQTKNALALVHKKAALHVPDDQAESMLVDECNRLLADKNMMAELSENILKLAVPNAAARIAEEITKWL